MDNKILLAEQTFETLRKLNNQIAELTETIETYQKKIEIYENIIEDYGTPESKLMKAIFIDDIPDETE